MVRAGRDSRVGGAGFEAETGGWKQERQAPPPGTHGVPAGVGKGAQQLWSQDPFALLKAMQDPESFCLCGFSYQY